MLRKGIKCNHIKCSVKTSKGRKREGKGTKNKCNKYKTVTNTLYINPNI